VGRGGPVWKADLNAGGFRVTNSSDGIEETDLATIRQVEAVVVADTLRQRLQAGGDAELNVSGLAGVLGEPQRMGIRVIPSADTLPGLNTAFPYEVISWQGKMYYFSPTPNPGQWVPLSAAASIVADTHANRLTLYPAASQPTGLLFWETDRTALYRITTAAGVNSWSLMLTRPMTSTFSSRPADLVTTDVGFRFAASDYGYQTWMWSGTAWALQEGQGQPMRGTLVSSDQRPVGLGTGDAGFRYEGTDVAEHYRWSGTAWVLLPNEETKSNLLKNGSFEWYEGWDPTATPSVYDPTYWTLESGAGTAGRSTTQVRANTYSLALANTAGNGMVYAQSPLSSISATTNSYARSRQMIFGCWVYASAASRARIQVYDGIGSTTSSYHTGVAGWEWLTVVHTLDAAATVLTVRLEVATGTAITTYWDGAVATWGSVPTRVATPYALDTHAYPYRVEVDLTGSKTISTATTTTIDWDAEVTDKGNFWVVGTPSRLTVPTGAGGTPSIWTAYVAITWDTNMTGDRVVTLLKNGATFARVSCDACTNRATDQALSFQAFDVADGDYFQISVYHDAGVNLDITSGNFGLCRVF